MENNCSVARVPASSPHARIRLVRPTTLARRSTPAPKVRPGWYAQGARWSPGAACIVGNAHALSIVSRGASRCRRGHWARGCANGHGDGRMPWAWAQWRSASVTSSMARPPRAAAGHHAPAPRQAGDHDAGSRRRHWARTASSAGTRAHASGERTSPAPRGDPTHSVSASAAGERARALVQFVASVPRAATQAYRWFTRPLARGRARARPRPPASTSGEHVEQPPPARSPHTAPRDPSLRRAPAPATVRRSDVPGRETGARARPHRNCHPSKSGSVASMTSASRARAHAARPARRRDATGRARRA